MKKLDSLFLHRLTFVMPALFLFVIFTYYPFFYGFFHSFTQWNGVTPPVFVGAKNYVDLFHDTSMIQAGKNTLYFVLLGIFVGNPLCFLIALALNRKLFTVGILRTFFYIPAIMGLMVVSVSWGDILGYDGLLNVLLKAVGLGHFVSDWFVYPKTALICIMLIIIWQGTGFGAIIYLAGLQGIPKELHESAEIDGANGWQKILKITIPLLMPAFTICIFIGLAGSLKMFDLPYVLTNGGPGDKTTTIGLQIYKFGFVYKTLGYANAAGICFMLIFAAITFYQVRITRKLEVEF